MSNEVFYQQQIEAAYNGNFQSIKAEVNNTSSALFCKSKDNRWIATMLILAIVRKHSDFFQHLLGHHHVMEYLRGKPANDLFQILETLLHTAAIYKQSEIIKQLLDRYPEQEHNLKKCIWQVQEYAKQQGDHALAQYLQENDFCEITYSTHSQR